MWASSGAGPLRSALSQECATARASRSQSKASTAPILWRSPPCAPPISQQSNPRAEFLACAQSLPVGQATRRPAHPSNPAACAERPSSQEAPPFAAAASGGLRAGGRWSSASAPGGCRGASSGLSCCGFFCSRGARGACRGDACGILPVPRACHEARRGFSQAVSGHGQALRASGAWGLGPSAAVHDCNKHG